MSFCFPKKTRVCSFKVLEHHLCNKEILNSFSTLVKIIFNAQTPQTILPSWGNMNSHGECPVPKFQEFTLRLLGEVRISPRPIFCPSHAGPRIFFENFWSISGGSPSNFNFSWGRCCHLSNSNFLFSIFREFWFICQFEFVLVVSWGIICWNACCPNRTLNMHCLMDGNKITLSLQMAKELDAILDHGEANIAASCETEGGSASFLKQIICPIYDTLSAVGTPSYFDDSFLIWKDASIVFFSWECQRCVVVFPCEYCVVFSCECFLRSWSFYVLSLFRSLLLWDFTGLPSLCFVCL